MSEILSNIVIEQIEATFQPEVSNLSITPNAISLNIYTGSAPIAAGSNTDVQFNLNGALYGSNAFTFNNSTNTVTVDNFVASDSANLGDASNVTILGGTNGYFLQTDGTGNLTWAAGGNGGGNGTPGGSNTQIQYNDAGAFGGNAGFTFNETNGNVNIPGNLIVAGNISGTFTGNAGNANYANFAGNVVNSSQPNITSVGTLTSLSVTGTMSAGNVTGNGAGLSSLNGSNVTGAVANATYATSAGTAGTVTTAAQPNITSVGTLTGLAINGALNISSNTVFANKIDANIGNFTGNINAANFVGNLYGNVNGNLANVTGSGANLTNLNASNLASGTVPTNRLSGTYNISITGSAASTAVANTVSDNAQPNITSVGNLTSLRVISSAINLGANTAISNIGNLYIAIGNGAGQANIQNESISIGNSAAINGAGAFTISIGTLAGNSTGSNVVAIGRLSGTSANASSIAIGAESGTNQQFGAVSLGSGAGVGSGNRAISIGYGAGSNGANYSVAIGQTATVAIEAISIGNLASAGAVKSVAIGPNSGTSTGANNSIAIGSSALTAAGSGLNAIAIGSNATAAGNSTVVGANANATTQNTIVINATGSNLYGNTANALFIKPVRTVNSTSGLNQLYYNPTTGEIVVYVP